MKQLVHTLDIPVRWVDMDAYHHVNNSVYFTYFEQTRIDWWYKIKPPEFDHHLEGHVVIHANCTFLKPINYPDTITVKLYVSPPGRSSYEFFYEIYSKQDPDILYTEGSTKMVWIDLKKGKAIRLPEYILAYLPKNPV